MNYIYHCPYCSKTYYLLERAKDDQVICKLCNSLTSYKGVYYLEKLSDEEKKELLAKWRQEDIDNKTYRGYDKSLIKNKKSKSTISLKIHIIADLAFIFFAIIGGLMLIAGVSNSTSIALTRPFGIIFLAFGTIILFIGYVLKLVLQGFAVIVKNSELSLEERKNQINQS